eukprot:TRINITY_DN12364_c0_g1_i2.p1 TRINITY_DN12364_c0_g1~~TRINITY_DN12364_c0_g1_i2.p1  ORF type:complete len:206 (-),score=15.16 TRINITY_DN12364_c0_g1_i2:255-872(-)
MGNAEHFGCASLEECPARVQDGCELLAGEMDSQELSNCKLLRASAEGNLRVMEEALNSGADINIRQTLVMRQANERHKSDVHSLEAGLTPLMRAALEGQSKAITLLVQRGANMNAEDEDGMTALHFAAAAACQDSCKALLNARASPLAVDRQGLSAYGHVPLECLYSKQERQSWQYLLSTDSAEDEQALFGSKADTIRASDFAVA